MNPYTGREEVVAYAFDEATLDLLRRVVGFYSRLDAGTLVELTHAPSGPWHKVWHHSGKINPGMRIDNRDIERFYARIPRFPTLQ